MRLVLVFLTVLLWAAHGSTAEPIRIGVLQFGTVNWELDVIKRHDLAQKRGLEIEVVGLTNKTATAVALQSGDVDIIVTDWIWVSRQRAEGAPYSFVPYSTAAGAIMVPGASKVADIAGLAGKRLGVAGGPLDKGWLLLQALAAQDSGLDFAEEVEAVFGAAPLLAQQALAGHLDGVLNFWHYAARLEAEGMRRLISVQDMMAQLGVEVPLPLIGYVFDENWAGQREADALTFFQASREARQTLATSDSAWQALRPLMKAPNEATFLALRAGYRDGIPRQWGPAEQAAAEHLFAILAKIGGRELVGRSDHLQEGTFWPPFQF
ncbi:MAG: ABC transporter substrate-binding protein [Pseudomonadota bacterium]